MTQINLIVNSLPRDLLEFMFFVVVGYTAGSIGMIWDLEDSCLNLLIYLYVI